MRRGGKIKIFPYLAVAWLAACTGRGMNPTAVKAESKRTAGSETESAPTMIATVDTNGVVTGAVSANSKTTQSMQASANSPIAGSTIAFPPGALAIDTQVSMQAGASLAQSQSLQAMNVDSSVTAAAPAVTIASSVPLDAATPFTLQIPVPAQASLDLTTGAPIDLNFMVVMYRVKKIKDGSEYSGIIPLKLLIVAGAFVKFQTQFFGTFQAIILKDLISEAREVTAPPLLSLKGRRHYQRGFLPTSFGANTPAAGGFHGWWDVFGPSRAVAPLSALTTDQISKERKDSGK